MECAFQSDDEASAGIKTVTPEPPIFEVLSEHAMQAVEDAILATNPEQTYVLTPSTSSRIKSMLIAFSPTCVSSSIIKHQKLGQEYEYTV